MWLNTRSLNSCLVSLYFIWPGGGFGLVCRGLWIKTSYLYKQNLQFTSKKKTNMNRCQRICNNLGSLETLSVADPGFPVSWGRGLPRQLRFENFVCQNQAVSKEISRKILDYNDRQSLTKIKDNYSDSTELYTDSDNTELYNDSDGTKLYDIDEVTISTIEYQVRKLDTVKSTKTKTHKVSLERKNNKASNRNQKSDYKLFTFKCPASSCSVHSNTCKNLHQHYRSSHKQVNNCHLCDKKYPTPHSLKRHLYTHQTSKMNHKYKKCRKSFRFVSQLKIHWLKHIKKLGFECNKCYQTYKFKHDMMKHKKQHSAPTVMYTFCDYEGTLKEHIRQHDRKNNIICRLCNKLFIFRMALWRHTKKCNIKRSNSPEY